MITKSNNFIYTNKKVVYAMFTHFRYYFLSSLHFIKMNYSSGLEHCNFEVVETGAVRAVQKFRDSFSYFPRCICELN